MAARVTTDTDRPAPRRASAEIIATDVLAWYDRERRDLPWRAKPGQVADPYAVWLSEIMLQQTTVKAAAPYFARFLNIWPTVEDLAAASEDQVLEVWAGLGYYSRARNLHKCAQAIVARFNGAFPRTECELATLPGIGPYTAAAIAAIVFDEPVMPVDGNIERVVSRLHAIDTPFPAGKAEIKRHARALAPKARSGDLAQAFMDLGATICTPKSPSCLMCPLSRHCEAHARGIAETLPVKAPKPERPVRHTIAFVAIRDDGAILLRRRPDTGLLARMMEVPTTDWVAAMPDAATAMRTAPLSARWLSAPGRVIHTFTHLRLEVQVMHALVETGTQLTMWADAPRCQWVPRRDLDRAALPSLMKKVIAAVLEPA